MKEISKYSRNQIEKIIMRYPEWKEEYDTAYELLLYKTPSKDGEIPCHTFSTGSRQERVVEAMETKHYQYIAEHIKAVDEAMVAVPEEKQKVIRLRYWSHPDKKLPYNVIARKCYMDERTVRRLCTAFILAVGKKVGIIG